MTNEELKTIFIYEAYGALRRIGGRKPYPWRAFGSGRRYKATTVNGTTYYLHRLIWQYHHGAVPRMVDHANGDTTDNRIENLRECTPAQNQYNSPRKANNKSGAKGVVHHPRCISRPWQAKIVVNGKVKSLGYHATVFEAAKAYTDAAQQVAGNFAMS